VKIHSLRLSLRLLAILCLATIGLTAADHRGIVKFGGLPVPGVTITATQGDTKLVKITDQQGFYSFANLADGVWKIQVEMLCFSPIEREVAVTADAPSAEWELKLLPFEEIKASAPAPETPPPATPAPGAAPPTQAAAQPAAAPAKPEQQAAAAPRKGGRNGKNPPPAPANTPTGFQRADVNASGDGAKPAGDGAAAVSPDDLNKAPSDGLLINGSVNNGAASPFAQSAAFGNNRRPGRSLYNGGIGLTFENSTLDARPFSLTGQDTAKPGYNRVQGMLNFGGPIRIPHLVPNGPNFVVNYQWLRNRNASTSPSLLPLSSQRIGDFSQIPLPVLDPASGLPFPGNVIPQNRFSPQAQALLGFYPLPNFAGDSRYNYQIPIVSNTHQDSLQSRINKTIGRKNQVNGTFAFQSTRTDTPNLFGFLDTNRSLGLTTSVNWMHRLTQRAFLTLGVQYSRMAARATPFFANRENISGEAGITGNNQEPVNWGPPSLTFTSGIAGLSDVQRSFTRSQTAGTSASLFWVHGSHNVTGGADFRRQQFNLLSQQDPRGSFTFTGAATGGAALGNGLDFADFLLGIPDTSSIAFGNADKYLRSASYDAYITDDWRVSPSLTLNAGFRWEYSSPITELYGRLVNLDIAPGFASEAPVVAGAPTGPVTGLQYPDSLVRPDKHAFQPRIGISWRPLLASSMVVRAGYGIYYNTSFYLPIASHMIQQSPLSKSLSVQNAPDNPLTLANGFHAAPNITTNTFAVNPGFLDGYAQNWNLSVQRDLPGSLVMTAIYLGIKGTRGQQAFLPNTYPVGVANPCPACPSGYTYLTSNGDSTHHSGQVQLRRRLHNGITAQLQYTFAKAIDDSALGGQNQGGSLIAQDWLNLSAERGLSNFDQRHLLNVQAQYTTGMGLGGGTLLGSWKGTLFKDWTFATQVTAGSGFPLTPVFVAPVAGTGVTGPIRADYTGQSIYAAPSGLFLNPAAVRAPVGHWGNAGRNSITGPDIFTLNASMARTFRLNDRLNADFRLDATNALNHVTYPSWNTAITSAQFGLPMTANGMRTVQATMRVRF